MKKFKRPSRGTLSMQIRIVSTPVHPSYIVYVTKFFFTSSHQEHPYKGDFAYYITLVKRVVVRKTLFKSSLLFTVVRQCRRCLLTLETPTGCMQWYFVFLIWHWDFVIRSASYFYHVYSYISRNLISYYSSSIQQYMYPRSYH